MSDNWAYLLGLAQGMGAAKSKIPKIGETYYTEKLGGVTATEQNVRDVHALIAHGQSKWWRLQSPMFHQIAEALNNAGEEAWDSFEKGVRDSVIEEVLRFDLEDYKNIEDEEEDEEEAQD